MYHTQTTVKCFFSMYSHNEHSFFWHSLIGGMYLNPILTEQVMKQLDHIQWSARFVAALASI